MKEGEGPRPRYQWKRIEHIGPLFSGYDGERPMGRIEAHQFGWWDWYMTFNHGLPGDPTVAKVNGQADTAREAAKACEDCYDAVISGTWPGITPEKLERILADERYRKGRQLK